MLGERRRRIATLALVALVATSLPSDALAKTVCPPPPLSAVPGATAVPVAVRLRRQLRRAEQQLAQARRAATRAPRRGAAARRAAARKRAAARRRAAAARKVTRRKRRAALEQAKKIRLVLEEPGANLSFARDPDVLDVPVVIRATRPIPRALTASDLREETLRDLHRIGDNLVSVPRVVARTSRLRITHARDRIYFSVCVDGRNLDAGSYVGAITISGPTRLARVDVPITVTVKNASFFWTGAFAALVIAGVFLLYKELRNDSKIRYANWLSDRRAMAAGDAKPALPADRATPEQQRHWLRRWWSAFWRRFRPRSAYFFSLQSHYGVDFWLLEWSVPLAAAFVAMYGIYASTPDWGQDAIAQWFGLITAAFTAAGVRSLIVSAVPEPRLPSGEAQRRHHGGAAAADQPRPRPRPSPAVARPAVPAAVPDQVRVVRPAHRPARATRAARPAGSARVARSARRARPARPARSARAARPARPAARPSSRRRRR